MAIDDESMADEFGQKIAQALRDKAAWRRLPRGGLRGEMRRRGEASEGSRKRSEAPEGPTRGREPANQDAEPANQGGGRRWLKVAASIAAMAAFVGLAAVVGRVVGGRLSAAAEPGGPRPVAAAISDSSKIEQGEDNMIMARKVAALAGAAVLTVSAPAAKLSSEPTFVFLRPETSSFWNTATNSTMTLPIDYPNGATKATLTVNGVGYNRVYSDLTGDSIEIDLPVPDSPKTENVYELTLAFDNGAAPRTAKLGLIKGLDSGAKGSTRCIAPAQGKVWSTATDRAVLPIPYGTTSFTVNGVEHDTGLDGAQGWYALSPIAPGAVISLSCLADGVSYAASILGGGNGLMLIYK